MVNKKDHSIIEGIPRDIQEGLTFHVVELRRAIPMPWLLQTFPAGFIMTSTEKILEDWDMFEEKEALEVASRILDSDERAIVILVDCLEVIGEQLKAGYFSRY